MIKVDVKILLIMMKEDYAAAYDFNEIERVVSVFLFSWIDHMDTLTLQIIHTLNDINNNCLLNQMTFRIHDHKQPVQKHAFSFSSDTSPENLSPFSTFAPVARACIFL